jgi:hypothetical protein
MTTIFISYREDDAKAWALLLRDELAAVFGEQQLFLDKDALRSGEWRAQIREGLNRCRVVLVIIGRRWLTVKDGSGQRRLDAAGDVHRQEIALALSLPQVTVIPVRVDGTVMPLADQLPEDIRSLTEQQSYEISDGRTRRVADLALLVADIKRLTGLPTRASQAPDRRRPLLLVWWLGRVAMIGLTGLAASVALMVGAGILLGWTFDTSEISLIVLICMAMMIPGWNLWARRKERRHHAGT